MDLRKNIAINIIRRRMELEISQEMLGGLCGLSTNSIGGIERCQKDLKIGTFEKIAVALEISPLELLKDPEENEAKE